MKPSELTGRALDWAVAKCEGLALHKDAVLNGVIQEGWQASGYYADTNLWIRLGQLRYSTNWAQGGPIIEREVVSIGVEDGGWRALCWGMDGPNPDLYSMRGPTPLIAAMRCYVASKLGDEVEVPNEL